MRLLRRGCCPFCRRPLAILRAHRGDGVMEERLVCSRCMDLAAMLRAMASRGQSEAETPPVAARIALLPDLNPPLLGSAHNQDEPDR